MTTMIALFVVAAVLLGRHVYSPPTKEGGR